jgi:hypothetical protein
MVYETRLVEPGIMPHDKPAVPAAPTERVPGPRETAPDPLAAFPTEAEVAAAAEAAAAAVPATAAVRASATAATAHASAVAATVDRRASRRRRTATRLLMVSAAAAVMAVAAWPLASGVGDTIRGAAGLGVHSTTGILAIETAPPGWDVVEGSRHLGSTPFRASLPAGKHSLVLRNGSDTRQLDVVLPAGAEVIHHLDLPSAPSTGMLRIATSPPGATVEIDGVGRGVSPVDVDGLAPGDHAVSVTAGNWSMTEQVAVTAGRTTALLVPVARPDTPVATVGFVTIAAPIELQVFDGDSLVGSSRNQRIMLMAGRRALRLANPALGFEREIQVTVAVGAVSKVTVPVPMGSLSVNAVPWAEVVLDGTVIGETPIANYAVSLGSHELLLRNPKFPEHRRTVVVTLAAPLRVGVDLRQ